ncbi:MAG: hypothetical protein ACE5FD_08605, partial [Anaerolineae bacterium]
MAVKETTIKSEKNVLEFSFTHYFLVGMNVPNGWPGWLVGLLGVGLAALVGWAWQGTDWALWAAGGQGLFLAADTAVLLILPRRHLSFGPWKSQFVALAVPRVLATAVLGFLAGWFGV